MVRLGHLMDPPYLILGAMVARLILNQFNQRAPSPVLAIVDRWLCWFVFSFFAAWVCRDYRLIDRPFWVLAAAFFLLWFLGVTLYNWLAIAALSSSPLPLFPRYELNKSGGEWPVQRRLLRIREWLRSEGFVLTQALKAAVGAGSYLRVSVYQDPTATVRLEVTFLPQRSGNVVVCYALTSLAPDGSRTVTDNLYVPFGGFYPENWYVERLPWCRSLRRLVKRHRARLAASRVEPVPFSTDPLIDFNATQHELERLNTELGFLHGYPEREDLGKISQEGRYRVWKEIWTLNYLGRSTRYR